MAKILPSKPVERLSWVEQHTPAWLLNATAIGTSAPLVTSLSAAAAAARAAYDAQQIALDNAKVATQTFHDCIATMTTGASDIIKQVKAKAATAGGGGNAIYGLALLPVPATPSPVPPPGTPTNFKISLAQSGALTLTWKCANPAGGGGTFYQVSRRIGGATAAFIPQTGVGSRTYTDATIPAGTASVTYQITATRTTAVGPTAEFTVNFGTGAGGEMTASLMSQGGAPKLAA